MPLVFYDEHTDRTLSVGRWDNEGEDLSLRNYAKVNKMKLLTLHTHACLKVSLRDCSSSSIKGLANLLSFVQMNWQVAPPSNCSHCTTRIK